MQLAQGGEYGYGAEHANIYAAVSANHADCTQEHSRQSKHQIPLPNAMPYVRVEEVCNCKGSMSVCTTVCTTVPGLTRQPSSGPASGSGKPPLPGGGPPSSGPPSSGGQPNAPRSSVRSRYVSNFSPAPPPG